MLAVAPTLHADSIYSGVIISGGHLIKFPSPVPANDSGAGLSPGGGEAFSSPLGEEDEEPVLSPRRMRGAVGF